MTAPKALPKTAKARVRRGIGSAAASRAASLYVDPTEEEEKSDVEAMESRRIHSV